MKFHFIVVFVVFFFSAFAQEKIQPKLCVGDWVAGLQLNDSTVLSFNVIVKDNFSLIIKNGEEEIQLEKAIYKNDSVHVRFPYFNSELIFKVLHKKSISGYWVNYNKGEEYKIAFWSKKQKSSRFSFVGKESPSINIDGRWAVVFQPNTISSYPAVGLFQQKENKNSVSGTFLTETGDYRFLEGNCKGDSLYLSCFDGSHAFLFKAQFINDSLIGRFYSGNHWESSWVGIKNPTYQLTNPDELTYIVAPEALQFQFQTINGENYSYPNKTLENKVIIIQIMGSWCPNCLDEVRYYKELHNKYHDQGLEIISICYEVGAGFNDYTKNITRLKNALDLDFTFLIGGAANKGLASKHFNILNEVISFPTSIFIGKDGKVKRVHTGFNGPGTGDYYKEYIEKTNSLIEALLLY